MKQLSCDAVLSFVTFGFIQSEECHIVATYSNHISRTALKNAILKELQRANVDNFLFPSHYHRFSVALVGEDAMTSWFGQIKLLSHLRTNAIAKKFNYFVDVRYFELPPPGEHVSRTLKCFYSQWTAVRGFADTVTQNRRVIGTIVFVQWNVALPSNSMPSAHKIWRRKECVHSMKKQLPSSFHPFYGLRISQSTKWGFQMSLELFICMLKMRQVSLI